MARVRPAQAGLIRFESAAAIRAEIARAVPLYRGIERLSAKGEEVQWGGRTLYADGRFATPDGKGHFSPVTPQRRPNDNAPGFRVSTRRGKQFNSMVQRETDPLTGARREDVLMSPDDIARMGVREGSAVELRSAQGAFRGRVKAAPMTPGNLELHWPEANVLLSGSAIDPESLEPDYNAIVTFHILDEG
jgi:predicted molibdopterin-dependent oxidoreductase YjgC